MINILYAFSLSHCIILDLTFHMQIDDLNHHTMRLPAECQLWHLELQQYAELMHKHSTFNTIRHRETLYGIFQEKSPYNGCQITCSPWHTTYNHILFTKEYKLYCLLFCFFLLLLPLPFKYSPQHPVSKYPHSMTMDVLWMLCHKVW
jgi:hypothetical protein